MKSLFSVCLLSFVSAMVSTVGYGYEVGPVPLGEITHPGYIAGLLQNPFSNLVDPTCFRNVYSSVGHAHLIAIGYRLVSVNVHQHGEYGNHGTSHVVENELEARLNYEPLPGISGETLNIFKVCQTK
jgi:hypothetical protein